MDSLLQEITVLPGVLGCFVLNKNGQVAGSKMPPIFKENSIQSMGSLVARIIQMGNIANLSFKDIEIKYNESIFIIKLLPGESLLIIICEPNANKSLVAMTTGMLGNDIATAMASQILATPVRRAPSPSPTQTAHTNKQKKEEAEIDGAMASVLEQVKDALAMAIGPIAGPVMKDAIEIWAHQTTPSFANLPNLVKLLCVEIHDTSLEKEFMAAVQKFSN